MLAAAQRRLNPPNGSRGCGSQETEVYSIVGCKLQDRITKLYPNSRTGECPAAAARLALGDSR